MVNSRRSWNNIWYIINVYMVYDGFLCKMLWFTSNYHAGFGQIPSSVPQIRPETLPLIGSAIILGRDIKLLDKIGQGTVQYCTAITPCQKINNHIYSADVELTLNMSCNVCKHEVVCYVLCCCWFLFTQITAVLKFVTVVSAPSHNTCY